MSGVGSHAFKGQFACIFVKSGGYMPPVPHDIVSYHINNLFIVGKRN